MFEEFLRKSTELLDQGETFAVATVVRCQPPTSGKPGDKAIIRTGGELWGWIGGGCAQPVVVREALKVLKRGHAVMVRISPAPGDSEEGIVDYTMTCHSGGALDIYIEPVTPKPQLVILGRSPVAQALARLGRAIDYSVSVVAEKLEGHDFADASLFEQKDFGLDRLKASGRTLIVVSTQGEGDEEALEHALRSRAAYVAFVASATKATKVIDYLRGRGIAEERLKMLHAPAGLSIGATSPPEIAVSILAEIVQVQHAAARQPAIQPTTEGQAKSKAESKREAQPLQPLPVIAAEDRDPICGMTVDLANARYKSEYRGRQFAFCCAGCKQAFDKEPEKYLAASA